MWRRSLCYDGHVTLGMRHSAELCVLLLVGLVAAHATDKAPAAAGGTAEAPTFARRPTPVLGWPQVAAGISGDDLATARQLFEKLAQKAVCEATDADAAAALVARPSAGAALRALAAAVLVSSARQASLARDCDGARARLQQAGNYSDDSGYVTYAALPVLVDCAAWPEAEATARDVLARDSEDEEAGFVLGYALMRQGRDQEALAAWDASPRLRERPSARRLRARLAKSLAVESGFRETQVAHFSLRYDGERHEELGDSVLAALERHYDTLVATFDYQPQEPVTVVLLTREAYYDATGAPRWSGGVFTTYDGRVRVPVLGVTPERVRALDGVLIHELTHAFLFEIAHGNAEWDLQEGLAQYMEGRRFSGLPVPSRVAGAPQGTQRVRLEYALALSFVEFLIGEGGFASLPALLTRLGAGDPAADAWQEVYGRSRAELKAAWRQTLRP